MTARLEKAQQDLQKKSDYASQQIKELVAADQKV